MLLSAPTYFDLKATEKGTVLVERGVFTEEGTSERYGNRQFYIMDEADQKLKCLSGGSLNYIVDLYNLMDGTKKVKITYDGTETLEKGKFAGKEAHQFKVELIEDMAKKEVANTPAPATVEQAEDASSEDDNSLDSLS